MRKIRYILSIYTFLVLLAVAAVLTGCGGYEKDAYYTVMLPSGEGYTVNSESIVRVLPGETAEFDVRIDSGYEFVKSSAGRFSDGKLIVDNVAFSVTVDLKARKTDDIAYMENGTVEVRSIGGGALFTDSSPSFVLRRMKITLSKSCISTERLTISTERLTGR